MLNNRLSNLLLGSALALSCDLARAEDSNLLPKYGPLPKTEGQKAADAKFISTIDEQYRGDRKKAAADLAARGWQYLSAGNFPLAMPRFNQAWLLDNSNGSALWGMAATQASSGRFDDSLKLFAEAEKFVGGDLNFSIDYTKTLGIAAVESKNEARLRDAFNRFESIYRKAPQNTNNLQNWAITLFSVGRYSDAWAKVKLAEATPNKSDMDPRFVADLQARMPRPKNGSGRLPTP